MRRLLVVVACLLGLSGAGHAQVLGPQEFMQNIARELNAASPQLGVTAGPELQLRFRREGKNGVLNLADIYKRYRENPALYALIVASLTDQLSHSKMPGQATRDSIVPLVRTRAWLAELQKSHNARKPADVAIYESLNKELILVYADRDNTDTRILSANEKLPVAREDLRALALSNLERLLPKPELRKPVPGAEVYAFINQDPHGSSLLLLDRFWTDGKIKVKGDIVVSIPVRKALMIGGSRDLVALETMRVAAAKFAEDGLEVQTETLFVYRKGKWAKFGRKSKKDETEQ
jgi:uncharacterized protein YtpQ (UPF0354 family)